MAPKGKGRPAKKPEPEPEPVDDGEGEEGDVPEEWESLLNGALDLCRVLGGGAAAAAARARRGRARGVGGRNRRGGDDEEDDEDDDNDEQVQALVDECQSAATECLSDFAQPSRLEFLANLHEVMENCLDSRHAEGPKQQKLLVKFVLQILAALHRITAQNVDKAMAADAKQAGAGAGAAGDAKDGEEQSDMVEIAGAFEIFEVTSNVMAQLDKRVFDANISEYIALVSRAALSDKLAFKVREQAVHSLCAATQGHVDVILKHKQLDAMLDLGFALCSDAKDVTMSIHAEAAQNFGTTLLDTLAGVMGQVPKAEAIIGHAIYERALKQLGGADQYKKKGALVCLAVLPENCADFLKAQDLDALHKTVTAQLDAKEELVRAAAAATLAEFATHMPEFFSKTLAPLTARVLNTLKEAKEAEIVKAKSCLLLLNLLERYPLPQLQANAKPILEATLQLITTLNSGPKPPAGDSECLRYSFSAIRGVFKLLGAGKVDSVKGLVPAVTTALTGFLALPDAKVMEALAAEQPRDENFVFTARGEATATLGAVVATMKADEFKSIQAKVLEILYGSYHYPCFRVRAAANGAFGDVASVMGEAFGAHLEKWMEIVMSQLDPSYVVTVRDGEQAMSEVAGDAVMAGLEALRQVAEATKAAFKPYVQPLFNKVVAADHLPPQEVAMLLGELPHAMPLDKPWVKGVPSQLSDEIKEVFEQAIQLLIDVIEQAEEEDAAAKALDAIGRIASAYGSAIVPDEVLERLVEVTNAVFDAEKNKADGDDEHEHGSDCDHDHDEEEPKPKKGKAKAKADAAAEPAKDDLAAAFSNIQLGGAADAGGAPKFEFNFNFSFDPAGTGAAAPAAPAQQQDAPAAAAAAAGAAAAPAAAAPAKPAAADAKAADAKTPVKPAEAAAAPAAAAAGAGAEAKEPEAEEDSNDEDGPDPDGSGLLSAIDLIGDLARVKGPAWFGPFRKFAPTLIEWAASHEHKRVRVQAFGALADAADSLDERFNAFVADCFPVCLDAIDPKHHPRDDAKGKGKALTQTDIALLRNATYCAGVMCMKGGDAANAYVEKALKCILPLLALKLDKADATYEDRGALRDNAASAVAKMILQRPMKADVMAQVLPAFLGALPLEVDMDENNFVYSGVIKMTHTFPKSYPGLIEAQYPRILDIFDAVLTTKPLKDTLKAFVAKTCTALLANAACSKAIDAWPAARKQAFLSVVSAGSVHGPAAGDAKDAAK